MSLQLRSLVDFCAFGPGGTVTVAITSSGLTPLVVMAALRRAGTAVYEPLNRFRLDVPADSFSSLAPVLARLRAVLHMQELHGSSYVLEGEIPAARIHELQQQLSGITRGEGRSSPRSSAMRPCRALRRLARAPTAIR